MKIRRASLRDARACAEIHLLARDAMEYLPASSATAAEVHAWKRDIVFARETVWVAEIDRRTVGYASAADGILNHLYVLPGQQGRGAGGALLAEAIPENPAGLRLRIFEANAGAIRLYRRYGFTTVEQSDGRANAERIPDRLMARLPD